MVKNRFKLTNLFNLCKEEQNIDNIESNINNNISPDKSELDIRNNKNYLKMVGLVLITGLSHGFVIGILSCLL